MLKLFIIMGLLSAPLSGCSNTANKLQAMWNIATDRSPTQLSVTPTQPDNFLETQKHIYSDKQIVSGNRLSKKTKNQLIQASLMARKSGGNVHVICPASATPEILQDIRATGVTYYKDNAMNNGYIIIFSKKKN
ncbi:MAG: hypothetical protein ACXWTN_07185 [Methylosarcina sp.]